jgi:hypothetical protein
MPQAARYAADLDLRPADEMKGIARVGNRKQSMNCRQ